MHRRPLNLAGGVIPVPKLPKYTSESLNLLIGSREVQITVPLVKPSACDVDVDLTCEAHMSGPPPFFLCLPPDPSPPRGPPPTAGPLLRRDAALLRPCSAPRTPRAHGRATAPAAVHAPCPPYGPLVEGAGEGRAVHGHRDSAPRSPTAPREQGWPRIPGSGVGGCPCLGVPACALR